MSIVQGSSESLKDYIKWFSAAYSVVRDPNDSFTVQAFRAGIFNKQVYYVLYDSSISSLYELFQKAQGLAEADETRESHVRRIDTRLLKRSDNPYPMPN